MEPESNPSQSGERHVNLLLFYQHSIFIIIIIVILFSSCRRQIRYQGTPRNIYRHIILSGEVSTTFRRVICATHANEPRQ